MVPRVLENPAEFVRTFAERALEYPIHVRGHPPGMPSCSSPASTGSGWAGRAGPPHS